MMEQRHAFVTGGGTGIGKAISMALCASGYVVSVAGRRLEPLETAVADISAAGEKGLAVAGFDVTDEASVEAGIARAMTHFGDIGVLVNCAGEAPSAPFEKTSLELWNKALDVNLKGTFLTTQAALPSIRRAGRGRIVNIASTAGLAGYAYITAYCAAKHGVIGLTRALALELAKTDITVNAVCPGFTRTPLIEGAIETIIAKTGRTADEALAGLARANPQGRLVQPEEVADAVMWLVGAGASSVTGQAIAVAGGEVMTG